MAPALENPDNHSNPFPFQERDNAPAFLDLDDSVSNHLFSPCAICLFRLLAQAARIGTNMPDMAAVRRLPFRSPAAIACVLMAGSPAAARRAQAYGV